METYVVRLDSGDHAEAMAALDLVKRETGTAALFVGRLAERPKFRGMAAGSLAALRDRDPTLH